MAKPKKEMQTKKELELLVRTVWLKVAFILTLSFLRCMRARRQIQT